jgi:DtxR family transcriptional regulator, Mn-dependent transcriptional regulator
MEPMDGLELPPRKVAYLKYIYDRGGPARTNDLAAEFGVDPSTITKTLAELTAAGFLLHEPYHGVSLSDTGRHYAEFLVKRHRILVLSLTHYGLSDEQACKEVSRFESLVSKDAIDRMCHAMGHPRRSGCGEITHDSGCLDHVH